MAAANDIPLDIIHTILLSLCVKSLLRFKTVCKSWNDIISDPRFIKIHRERFKNSNPRNLFLCRTTADKELCLYKFEKKELEFNSMLQQPHGKVVCMGDGLVLLRNMTTCTEGSLYGLWNPSSRKHALFWCPYRWSYCSTRFGLCRDPNSDDYKVVARCKAHYAVFSCKNNFWTKKQKFPYRTTRMYQAEAGLYIDGFCFWILEDDNYRAKDIIYFDPRDDKFKKLQKPNLLGVISFYLTSLGGCLCAYDKTTRGICTILRVWTMRGHVDSCSWSELRSIEIMQGNDYWGCRTWPMFLSEKNEMVISVDRSGHIVSPSTTFKSLGVLGYGICCDFGIVPYAESLLFPIRESTRPKRKRNSFRNLNVTDDDEEESQT